MDGHPRLLPPGQPSTQLDLNLSTGVEEGGALSIDENARHLEIDRIESERRDFPHRPNGGGAGSDHLLGLESQFDFDPDVLCQDRAVRRVMLGRSRQGKPLGLAIGTQLPLLMLAHSAIIPAGQSPERGISRTQRTARLIGTLRRAPTGRLFVRISRSAPEG